MKIAILAILLTLGLASILWNSNKEKPEPIAPNEIVSEQMIKQDIHTERHHQLIAPHHTEAQKTDEITVKGSVVNEQRPTQDNPPLTPEDDKILKRTAREVKEILDSNNKNPTNEFAKASALNFSSPVVGMFAGYFLDAHSNINLAIFADETGLSDHTCVETPDKQTTSPPKLQMRSQGDGIILVKVADKYYLRLGMEFRGNRTLIGKLYTKVGDKWSFTADFEANENNVGKILEPCHFN